LENSILGRKNKTKGEKMNTKRSTLYLTRGAMISALYVAVTWLCSIVGLSSGVIQFRLSEALCILPVFMPEAVPALFIGCLLSNIIAGGVIWDIIFGSIATLIGAIGARLLKGLPRGVIFLATVPTLLSNAIIVPYVLIYAYGVTDAYWFLLTTVGIGELVCASVGGTALYFGIRKLFK
jgi:uncharacterized membrane protein